MFPSPPLPCTAVKTNASPFLWNSAELRLDMQAKDLRDTLRAGNGSGEEIRGLVKQEDLASEILQREVNIER